MHPYLHFTPAYGFIPILSLVLGVICFHFGGMFFPFPSVPVLQCAVRDWPGDRICWLVIPGVPAHSRGDPLPLQASKGASSSPLNLRFVVVLHRYQSLFSQAPSTRLYRGCQPVVLPCSFELLLLLLFSLSTSPTLSWLSSLPLLLLPLLLFVICGRC